MVCDRGLKMENKHYYSAATGGFYSTERTTVDVMPPDVVELDPNEYRALLSAQEAGLVINADANGQPVAGDPPPPTPDQFSGLVGRAVDAKLDALARAWRYRDYISARSYRDDPNPRYAAEADALIEYGSACWTVLDGIESAVRAGSAAMPADVGQVLAMLPEPPDRPLIEGLS